MFDRAVKTARNLSARAGLAVAERAMGASWRNWLRGDDAPGSVGFRGGRPDGLDAPWTGIAVRSIAETIARTPWRVVDDDDREVDNGDLIRLLRRPHPQQSGEDFIEELAVVILGNGGAAIVKEFGSTGIGTPSKPGRVPTALIVVEPNRLTPVWGMSPEMLRPRLVAWQFRPRPEHGLGDTGAGAMRVLSVDQVIPIRMPDGTTANPVRGLSPRVGSQPAIDLQRESLEFAVEYFREDAMVGERYGTDSALHDDHRKEIMDALKRHRRKGRHHPLLLWKGVKPLGSAPMKDMAMPELNRLIRELQLAGYGVPPIVGGVVDDANRSNSEAQLLQFIEGPVQALASRISAAINHGLIAAHNFSAAASENAGRPRVSRTAHALIRDSRSRVDQERRSRTLYRDALVRMGGDSGARLREEFTGVPDRTLTFFVDFDSHPSVAKARLGLAPHGLTLTQMGVALNGALDILDLPIDREPDGDVSLLPFNLVPRKEIINPPKPSLVPDEPDDKDEAKPDPTKEKVESAKPEPDVADDDKASPDALVRAVGGVRAAALRGIADRHRRSWAPLAAEMDRRTVRHLKRQLEEVLERIEDNVDPDEVSPGEPNPGKRSAGSIGPERLARLTFDLDAAEDSITALARPVADASARLGGAQGLSEAGVPDDKLRELTDLLIDDPAVKRATERMSAHYRLIERSRHARVQEVIRAAFEDPAKGYVDLVSDLKAFYDGDYTAARRTAHTQVTEVLNAGRHEGMRNGGASGKLWITTSPKPRASHEQAQRDYGTSPIPIDQPFLVGDSALMYPADPNATPKERVNCYCIQLAAFLDEKGLDRTIARYGAKEFVDASRAGIRMETLECPD